MSGVVKLTPPEPERDAAVPVIIEEENTKKPRKSSLMHHSDNPGPDKLVTPAQAAFRKKSVGFRPSSSFEVHEEKAEDDADGADEAEKEDGTSIESARRFLSFVLRFDFRFPISTTGRGRRRGCPENSSETSNATEKQEKVRQHKIAKLKSVLYLYQFLKVKSTNFHETVSDVCA